MTFWQLSQAPEFLPRGGSGLVSPNFDGDFGELREDEDVPDDPSGMWYHPALIDSK